MACNLVSGSQYNGQFFTKANDRDLVDADEIPSVLIYKNSVRTSISISTVKFDDTGSYSYSFRIPSDWIQGDSVWAVISCVVKGLRMENRVLLGLITDTLESATLKFVYPADSINMNDDQEEVKIDNEQMGMVIDCD
jgi:hypothetical protein